MIVLATGSPTAKVEGEQIAVRFPSGKDGLTVALDLNQAFMLEQMVRNAAIQAMQERRARPVPQMAEGATLYAFPAR